MNISLWLFKQKSRSGYVIVNTRTGRQLFFTGIFEGIGRNMSPDLEDAHVFETRSQAEEYMALNALVDDLDVRSYEVRHSGFGRRARSYARAILNNQHIKDIAGLAAVSLFMANACVWLAILSSWRGV